MPSGVTSLDVIAYGARGGAGVAGQHGGAGTPARVATTLPVTPRETLYIVVGGRGADSDSSSRDGCGNYKCLFAAGGWGGGGASGPIPDVGQPAPLSGGGGGGASDVRTKPMGSDASLASRLIVAGGAGGDGGARVPGAFGAGSGGSAGATGGNGGSAAHDVAGSGGLPGEPAAPGTGGGGGGQSGSPDRFSPGQTGLAGGIPLKAPDQGGLGGGNVETESPPFNDGGSGGGGGGGVFGGGGGGGGGLFHDSGTGEIDAGGGGGGGGGASNPFGGQLTFQGAPTPDGLVQITWNGSPARDPKKDLKELGGQEARSALEEALKQCGGLALSANGLAGALSAATGLGAGPTSEVALLIGTYGRMSALKTLLKQPFGDLSAQSGSCAAALVWFGQAYKTFKDPPAPAFLQVALPIDPHLRALTLCTSYRAGKRALCLKLQGLLGSAALQTAGVAELYGAIATATARLTAAQSAGSAGGVTLQTAALEGLHGELAGLLRRLEAAERALGRLFASHVGRVRLNAKATAKIERYVVGRAARLGISRQDVAALAPTDRRLELVSAFGRRQDAAGAAAVAQAISVEGLRALASSLASGTAALRLSADLDAVQSAASRSAVHAAVARFVADCAKLAGPAGELLRAAAAPLA